MKKMIVAVASILLLTSAGVGYAAYQSDSYEADLVQEHVQVKENKADDTLGFDEYKTLEQVINLDELHHEVLEDHQHKRVILFSDDNNEAKVKSIFVKQTEKLKVIDFTRGLIFNDIITNTEKNKAQEEKVTATPNQELAKKEEAESQQVASEMQAYTEYATIANKINTSGLSTQVAKDNRGKRIILFKDHHGQVKYKSIFIKNKNHLKIIQTNGGLVYNGEI